MDETTVSRLEQLLEDTLELAEENNKMLHRIERTARWSFWTKAIMWIAVLVLPFLLIGPLLHTLLPISDTAGAGHGSIFGIPSPEQLKGMLLEAYKQASTTAP